MVKISHAVIGSRGELPDIYKRVTDQAHEQCASQWSLGTLAGAQGDYSRQEAHWLAYLDCQDAKALSLVHAAAPTSLTLAEHAVRVYPQSSEGWFWLGEIYNTNGEKDPAQIAFQRAITADPTAGTAWCQLGSLLTSSDLVKAREAFASCCINGDPGVNGCWNAGMISEQLGDKEQAIHYYLLSRWPQAQQKAKDLENRP
ncbi:MAG: tetratricopeptide repeat protein [Chloroflexota bacterium]